MPLVNPLTLAEVAGAATVTLPPAGDEVTVYEVIALPPSDTGAVHDTLAEALPPVALTSVGAPGALAGATGVTLFEGNEAGLLPTAFVATTVNV